MTLTPQDIQSQQFHVRFRGFDVEEVDNFLERIAEEFLLLLEENKNLKEERETLRKEIDTYHVREKSFQNAILSAQQIAEEMKEKSRREAEEILIAAKNEARQLEREANAEVAALEGDVDRLKKMKAESRQELQRVLYNYLTQLEEGFTARVEPGERPQEGGIGLPEANNREIPKEEEEEQQESIVDLSDLYERIDLSDDFTETPPGHQTAAPAEENDVLELFKMGEAEEELLGNSLPDLDGDMLFSLEDPLDEEERAEEGPDIFFSDESLAEEEKNK
jgi:cell division initiation protein